jgi:hypothetical protein
VISAMCPFLAGGRARPRAWPWINQEIESEHVARSRAWPALASVAVAGGRGRRPGDTRNLPCQCYSATMRVMEHDDKSSRVYASFHGAMPLLTICFIAAACILACSAKERDTKHLQCAAGQVCNAWSEPLRTGYEANVRCERDSCDTWNTVCALTYMDAGFRAAQCTFATVEQFDDRIIGAGVMAALLDRQKQDASICCHDCERTSPFARADLKPCLEQLQRQACDQIGTLPTVCSIYMSTAALTAAIAQGREIVRSGAVRRPD